MQIKIQSTKRIQVGQIEVDIYQEFKNNKCLYIIPMFDHFIYTSEFGQMYGFTNGWNRF